MSLNAKNSPALRQISYERRLDRLHPTQSEGDGKRPALEGIGEASRRADSIVKTTANQWG